MQVKPEIRAILLDSLKGDRMKAEDEHARYSMQRAMTNSELVVRSVLQPKIDRLEGYLKGLREAIEVVESL